MLLLTVACVALGTAGAAHDGTETRIRHLDGTGTSTIVDVHPSVPGAAEFARATPGPIPRPGELLLPASATPTWSAAPTPSPPRVGTR